jgi:hypothetical protein
MMLMFGPSSFDEQIDLVGNLYALVMSGDDAGPSAPLKYASLQNPGHFEPKFLSVATCVRVLLCEGAAVHAQGPKLVP